MIKSIAVFGLGKVGSLVGTLLSTKFEVEGIDQNTAKEALPFPVKNADVTDEQAVREILKEKDALVSCLPYFLNSDLAALASKMGVHYFDLTEDIATLDTIQKLAKKSSSVM